MTLSWTRESPATWDDEKARIVGGADAGIFDRRFREMRPGALVPGDWFRVEDGGRVLGYGWMDVVWGDAEILLATEPGSTRKGVGAFVLARLDEEARSRGLNYLYNLVRPTHPRGAELSAWLTKHGFVAAEDGTLRRRVGSAA